MRESEDLMLDIPVESGYIWSQLMHETLILSICLPYLNMFQWEPWRENLLVGVSRHLRGVLKKDHILGEYLLSQLFQKMSGIDALSFSKLRKLLSRGPRSFFLLIKPFGNEYIYYRRSRKDESRYLVARKGNCILAPHQCKKYSFMILC